MTLRTRNLAALPDSETTCDRCGIAMKEAGRLWMVDEPLVLSGSVPHEWIPFDVRICPTCGKSEFYL